jgi:hypothetical protein
MIILLNIARLLMVLWIVYGLLLMFAPGVIHSQPNPTSGAIQAIVAFARLFVGSRAIAGTAAKSAKRGRGSDIWLNRGSAATQRPGRPLFSAIKSTPPLRQKRDSRLTRVAGLRRPRPRSRER